MNSIIMKEHKKFIKILLGIIGIWTGSYVMFSPIVAAEEDHYDTSLQVITGNFEVLAIVSIGIVAIAVGGYLIKENVD